jgi:LAO/AO transport system kinase
MTDSIEAWVEQICAGDRRAIARAISAVENHHDAAVPLLKGLFPKTGNGFVIGVTGAPGVGKSTLLEKLASAYRRDGIPVGVLAVDPTSPFSGGAILGDRIRMPTLSTDGGVYIRSMATRGQHGGLAPEVRDVVAILDAAGCRVIFVETVGVGQDEVDIARLADVTVLLLAPGLGDELQTYKAGVMEIADVFVVNKADQQGSERVEEQLAAMLSAAPSRDPWKPPIVATVGTTGQGVPALRAALENFHAQSGAGGLAAERKRAHVRAWLVELLRARTLATVVAPQGGAGQLESLIGDVLSLRHDPYSVVEQIMAGARVAAADPSRRARRPDEVRLHHLGIAVESLAETVPVFEKLLGCRPSSQEVVEDQRLRVAVFCIGECRIELLEPTSPECAVAKFLSKRGQGIHHVTLAVEDLAKRLALLERDGFRLIDHEPRVGAEKKKIAFLHPSSTAGVLVELVEDLRSDKDFSGGEGGS